MTQEAQTIPAKSGPNDQSEPRSRAPRQQRNSDPVKRATKSENIIALLSRKRGASIDDMMTATGWQAHSVRGFLAGTVKKKLGCAVISEAGDKGRIYRIVAEAQ
jgi:hypothetical protein